MRGILIQVAVWEVLLVGWWAVSRRLRRLERSMRPPCYEHVGVIREQVVGLREEQEYDAEETARSSRELEKALAQLADEIRFHFSRQESTSTATMEIIGRVDERLRQLAVEDRG